MARDQVARLYRAAKTDSLLKAKLNQAPDLESFVEMARAEGYEFTIEEWQQMTNFEVEELKCNLSEIPGIQACELNKLFKPNIVEAGVDHLNNIGFEIMA